MSTLNDLMDAVRDLIRANVATKRMVTRAFRDLEALPDEQAERGVFTLIAQGEQDFANYRGREAQLGTLRAIVSGQFKLGEGATGEDIEREEFAMVEELKAVAQLRHWPAPITAFELVEWSQSSQIEAPYGWIVARVNLRST